MLFTKLFISLFGTSVPSAFIIVFIIETSTLFPPFASVLIYFAICNGLNSLSPCPIEAFNVSPETHVSPLACLTSLLARTPFVSDGNSIPVLLPSPKYFANFTKLSIPILFPTS